MRTLGFGILAILVGCTGQKLHYGGVNSIRDPELVVDTPWRIEPGEDLPVYMLLKDAEHEQILLSGFRFDVLVGDAWQPILGEDIYEVALRPETDGDQATLVRHPSDPTLVLSYPVEGPPLWFRTSWQEAICYIRHRALERADTGDGVVFLRACAAGAMGELRPERWLFRVQVARSPRTGGRAFRALLRANHGALPPDAGGLLARMDRVRLGDTHLHSKFTRNLMEYGYSPWAIRAAGDAVGLDWAVLTDHSCDFDRDLGAQQIRHNAVPHPSYTLSEDAQVLARRSWTHQWEEIEEASWTMDAPQGTTGSIAAHARDGAGADRFLLLQGIEFHVQKAGNIGDPSDLHDAVHFASPLPGLIEDSLLSTEEARPWSTLHSLLMPDPATGREPRMEYVYSGSGTKKVARGFFLSKLLPALTDIWINVDIDDPPDSPIHWLDASVACGVEEPMPRDWPAWRVREARVRASEKNAATPMMFAAHPLDPPASVQLGGRWTVRDYFDPHTLRVWDFMKGMQLWNTRKTRQLRAEDLQDDSPDPVGLRRAFEGRPIPWHVEGAPIAADVETTESSPWLLEQGVRVWEQFLLDALENWPEEGKEAGKRPARLVICAGSDAHGAMNLECRPGDLSQAVAVEDIALEPNDNAYGKVWTIVSLENANAGSAGEMRGRILAALRDGTGAISDGPIVLAEIAGGSQLAFLGNAQEPELPKFDPARAEVRILWTWTEEDGEPLTEERLGVRGGDLPACRIVVGMKGRGIASLPLEPGAPVTLDRGVRVAYRVLPLSAILGAQTSGGRGFAGQPFFVRFEVAHHPAGPCATDRAQLESDVHRCITNPIWARVAE